jgi:biopolymer transport protein ExbB
MQNHHTHHRTFLPGRLTAAAAALAFFLGAAAAWAESSSIASAPETATANSTAENQIPTQDLWDIIVSGGVLMIPLGVCSLLLLALVFERTISLRRGRVIPKPFTRRFLEQMRAGELDREQAIELCEESGSPVAEVFAGAVRKWGRPAVEVEQGIIDAGERVTNTLRRYLRMLNAIATLSPLLGFLGTVFGMIQAFNAIASSDALGRPELLAAGISQALITTAAGLTVAIPTAFFYLLFASRVDHLIMDIDALGQELVPLLCAEEMGSSQKSSAAAKVSGASKTPRKNGRAAAA